MRRVDKLALAALGLAVLLGVVNHFRVTSFMRGIRQEVERAKSQPRAFLLIDGRVLFQPAGVERAEWMRAARRELDLLTREDLPGYECTLLEGCSVRGGTVLVCTPPGGDHEADKAAACAEFSCDCD